MRPLKHIFLFLLLLVLTSAFGSGKVRCSDWPELEALRNSAIPNHQGLPSKGMVNPEGKSIVWIVFGPVHDWEIYLLSWKLNKGMVLYEEDGKIKYDLLDDVQFIPMEDGNFGYGYTVVAYGMVDPDQQGIKEFLSGEFEELAKSPLSGTEAAIQASKLMFPKEGSK